jgi:hypothetical protein
MTVVSIKKYAATIPDYVVERGYIRKLNNGGNDGVSNV